MIHTNKVRRILRAKNGSQISKFQNGGSSWKMISLLNINPATIGSQIPTSNVDDKLIQSPTTQQFKQLTYGNPKLTGFDALNKENLITKKYEESLKMSGFKVPELTKPNTEFISRSQLDKDIRSAKWQNLKNNVGNFISNNASLIGTGLDYFGNQFNDTINSSGYDTAMGVLNTAGNIAMSIDPVVGLGVKAGSFLINGINSIGGKRADSFSTNQWTLSQVGGSYGGSVADINDAQSKQGKKYGMFNGGARRRANRLIADAKRQQNIMTDIAEEAYDQRMLAGNDLNYLQYNMDINGGYDQRYIRAAKSGMKLSDKISLIKSRKYVNHYIDLNSRQVEEFAKGGTLDWEPVIEDIFESDIEIPEFQEGGSIKENWEPTIEILDDLPEYKSGGKTRTLEELIEYAKQQNPRFIQRLSEEPKGIEFTDDNGNIGIGNVFLEWSIDDNGNAIIYPRIQEIEDKNLKFLSGNEAYKRAVENKNFLMMSPKEADIFFAPDNEYGTAYKRGWPNMFKSSIWKHEQGGKTKNTLETPEIEETTQKNIIPEGALHKNKHHIEHTEGLTQKGIPVVDNNGNQQAEVEKEEIIFSLEVTKKLEELYKDYYDSDKSQKEKDEAAIEAGKLLVYQILFNTDDRTQLIKRCEEGGKLCQ